MTQDEVASLVGAQTAAELQAGHPGGLPARRRPGAPSGASSWRTPSWSSAWTPDGTLVLADEVLTPDSSRFWPAESYSPGRPQHSFDKQYLRDWSASTGWDRTAPGPEIPADVLGVLTARYAELFEKHHRAARAGAVTQRPSQFAGQ